MAEWRGVGGRLLLGKDPEPRGDDEPPVVAQDGAASSYRVIAQKGSIPGGSNQATGAWRRSHAQEACG